MKLIYLIFIHCTYKFERYKQSLLVEKYEQTFRSRTLFLLSLLEIISFLMSKLISFLTLFFWLMAKIM